VKAEQLANVGHWRWTIGADRIEFLADGIFEIFGIGREESPATLDAMLSYVPEGERKEFRHSLISPPAERVLSGKTPLFEKIKLFAVFGPGLL